MKELQELLEAKRKEARQLYTEIDSILVRLRGICDHSKNELYMWESDNGYGRQTMIAGRRCSYCGFIDLWHRGRFVDPLEIG